MLSNQSIRAFSIAIIVVLNSQCDNSNILLMSGSDACSIFPNFIFRLLVYLIIFVFMAGHDVPSTGSRGYSSLWNSTLWNNNSLFLPLCLSNLGGKHFALFLLTFRAKKSWSLSLFRFLLVVRTDWWLTNSLYVKLNVFFPPDSFFR